MRDIEKYTSDYKKPNFEAFQSRYRKRKIIDILSKEVHSHKKILEIGCGEEPLFLYLDESFYDSYTLVEPSGDFFANAVMLAGTNSKISCINEEFHVSENITGKQFDFIILSSLLHEIEDQDQMLRDIASVCGKDTIVHINVPNANSFHRLLAWEMGLIEDLHDMTERNLLYQQHNVFDIDALCEISERNGFTVKDKGSYFIKPFTHSQMYSMMREGIIDERVLDGLYKMGEKDAVNIGSEIYVNLVLSDCA